MHLFNKEILLKLCTLILDDSASVHCNFNAVRYEVLWSIPKKHTQNICVLAASRNEAKLRQR